MYEMKCIPASVESCIIDSECVAWDRENKKILPFQVLSTRARKVSVLMDYEEQDVKEEDIKINVVIFMFDLLLLNGEALLQKPLQERRQLLRSTIHEVEGRMQFATSREVEAMLLNKVQLEDTEQMQEFLMESVSNGCEGLMVKTLVDNATYEPSKRSLNWLKVSS